MRGGCEAGLRGASPGDAASRSRVGLAVLRVTAPFSFPLFICKDAMLVGRAVPPARSLGKVLDAGASRHFWGWLNAVFNK